MAHYLFYFVLLVSLRNIFSFPSNPFTRGGFWYVEEQQEKKCFAHVKIQSCQEARTIQIRVEGKSQDPLMVLQMDVKSSDQDVCLPVPCVGGQLSESVEIKATSEAGTSVNIAVTPDKLDSGFSGLEQDGTKCFGDAPPDVNMICKHEQSGSKFVDVEEQLRELSVESIGNEEVVSENYVTHDGYNNEYQQLLNFSCGGYKALNSLESRYDNAKKDRQYKLGCRLVTKDPTPFYCYWSGMVNTYEDPFIYSCPENFVMSGMISKHSSSQTDRQWWFQCCYAMNYVTKDCKVTGYVGNLHHNFEFNMGDRVLTGAHSYYDFCKKDRRWSLIHCNYVKTQGAVH